MTRRFAKLFDTATTQVLMFYSRDDNDYPKIFRWLYLGEMEIGLHLSWTDDSKKSWDAADKAFDAQTQETAEELVKLASDKFCVAP